MAHYTQVILPNTVDWSSMANSSAVLRDGRIFDERDNRDAILIHNTQWTDDLIESNAVIFTPVSVTISQMEVADVSDDIDVELW